MNKKNLLKIFVFFLGCAGLAVTANRMPLLMRAVYDAVFNEFDHITLFFVIGVFLFEIVILKKWGNDKNNRLLCLGIAAVTAALVLFKGSTSFVDKLAPGADTTIIARVAKDSTIDEINIQKIFNEYYFEGKNLVVSEQEKETADFQLISKLAVPADQIIAGEETVLSEEAVRLLMSYPCREYDPYCFVVDESWRTTDTIRMAVWGEWHIFCSEELLESVQAGGNSYDGEDWNAFESIGESVENSPYREFKQILVMLLLFAVGGAVSLPLLGERYPWLPFFLSLPIGAAIWCACGTVFMMLGIPYSLFTMLPVLALGMGVWLYMRRKELKAVDWQAFFNFILPAVFTAVLFAYLKICSTSADSLMKCAYGYRLARFGSLNEILGEAAPYGILEPMIMSIGYLVKCDALYVFYPLMAACGVGILCTGLHYTNGKRDNALSFLVLGAGLLFLFTNFDYAMSTIVMLAHGPIAVYTLILIMLIVMKREIAVPGFEVMASLAAAMVLMTRVEGAIYVLFFLALSIGIENESLKMYKVNTAVAGVIVVWNVFQMIVIGSGSNPMFWTPDRGALLIAGAVFLLALTWLMGRRWKLVEFVRTHYFLIAPGMLCLCIVVLAVSVAREIASINLPYFLSHFSNNERMNDRINAGGLWAFLLLLSPIVLGTKKRMAQYSVSLTVGFILLIYFVCLFRADVPLHYGYFDSGRRTLVQIMPTAVWLLAYSVGLGEERVQVKDER